MITDILSSTSVERLKGILHRRYGKGLEVSFLNDSRIVEQTGGAFSVLEGDLHIPIQSNGQFLALAKIPEAESLPQSSQEAISEIVRLILEPAFYNWFLRQSEENREASDLQKIGGLQIIDEAQELTDESEDFSEEMDQHAPVILITSKNPHRIPRVAQQVHDTLNRWAFVRWSELGNQVKTLQDLRSLGAMTILVEDLMHLSEEEKTLLNEWAQTSQEGSEPALIIGSTLGWNEIKDQRVLPEALLFQSGFYQIEADRLPSDRRFCEEAIKLLLDKEAAVQ